MQAVSRESELRSSSPGLAPDFQDGFAEDFREKMKIRDSDDDQTEELVPSDEEVEDDDDDFTFACVGGGESPISAADAFQNGQIKPIFPLFDQSLVYASDSEDDFPRRPPVSKIFVEAEESSSSSTSQKSEGETAGPYCSWSGKAVQASPEACKKSNSTGFSKMWRFRDLVNRSNSDGRDAFVFLNNGSTAASSKRDEKVNKCEGSSERKTDAEAEAKTKPNLPGGKVKAKKGGKSQMTSLSAHELHYKKNRAMREEDRRRSYLPYRPELVGFFTNVHGGLSRNVHPF